jgi:hypothetical protein
LVGFGSKSGVVVITELFVVLPADRATAVTGDLMVAD